MASGRETASNLHENIIVGRDAECKDILDKIQEQVDSDSSIPLVICIVGEGGIGKTTLAQLVYNHEAVATDVFDQKIWVCVANNFDEVRITKQVLSEVRPQNLKHTSWNQTIKELQESLRLKKSLIVLDDIWVERDQDTVMNKEAWKKFFATFEGCKGGSSIMVTTRLASVAKMIDNCMKVDLNGLSIKESNSLFMSHAFPGSDSSATHGKELEAIGEKMVDSKLKAIGEKIVDKLNGLPLALKLVGMHLRDKHSIGDWEDVLKNTKKAAGNVLSVLKLSYDHLPSHLKPCFGYCSLFPKGHYFTKNRVDQLIHMWIAQDFVHKENEDDRSLEVIGRCYFDDLCSRFFFQIIKTGYTSHMNSYVMHDLINDLALSVSKEECCQMLNNQSYIPSTMLRHVSVSGIHLPILSTKIRKLDKLRTLLVLNQSEGHVCIPMHNEILASLTGARVLDLSGCCIKQLPETIEQMIHLRYLAFNPTSTLLPKTCSRLLNLQVVNMTRDIRWIRGECEKDLDKCAPKYMSSLNNLRHVYALDGQTIEITGHYKIPQFHGDALFTVNNGKKLEDIQDIGFQGSLVIRKLENVASKYDAQKAQIGRKEHMEELTLEWCSSTGASRNNDNDVLDVLQPPSNLCTLKVHGYRGVKSPFWLANDHLTNLRSLSLSSCSELGELPPLRDLPKLENLRISSLYAIKEIPQKFYGTTKFMGFPSLEYLELIDMRNLVGWSMPECRPLFPLLKNVSIKECHKLKRVPNFLFTRGNTISWSDNFEDFVFAFVSCAPTRSSRVQDNVVENLKQMENAIFWKVTDNSGFKFVSTSKIKSLFGVETSNLEILDIDRDFHSHLEAIKDLYLFKFRRPLPEDGFTKLSSLERLSIENSEVDLMFRGRKEEDDDVDLLPTSLKYLKIKGCRARSNFFPDACSLAPLLSS